MIAQLTVSERQIASVIAAAVAITGAAMASFGRSDVLGVHGVIVMFFAGGLLYVIMFSFYAPEPTEDREASYYDDPIKVGIALSMAWAVFGMFMGVWVAAQLAWPDLAFDAGWSSFGRLQAHAHYGRDLRLRRQRADRDLLPRRPAHLPGAPGGPAQPLVRAFRLQPFLRAGRLGLSDGRHPVQGVRRGRMVRRPLAGHRLGHLLRPLHQDDRAPEGAAHLRRQLVLHGVHPGRRDPSHRQQPRPSGLLGPCQELYDLAGRAGRDGAVVVRAQRGRLLPDGRLPRDALLLPARPGAAADLLLPAVDPELLGHHLLLHVGGFPPPALHGPAALGPDARHDVLGDAAGAVLGVGGQRAADAQRRVAPRAGRRDAALHDGRCGLLRTFDLRRLVPRHQAGELAVALHRLDCRPRPCRRAGMGRADHLRLALHAGPSPLEARAHVFGGSRRGPFLAGDRGNADLRLRDVELRHHPGTDVADLHRGRGARLFVRRFAGGDVSLLHRPRLRRPALPAGRGGRLLQHLDDGPVRAARGDAGSGHARRRPPPCRGNDEMPELFHRKLERSAIGFVIAIIAAASVGGIVEIAPLFTIDETVEQAPDMRLYTPLELAGRNIYIREGCYACHSQMIRTLRDEVERYGPYSLAVEFQVRPPDALGLQADRTGPRAHRRQIFRLLACRASDQSSRRRSGVEHARLSVAGPHLA